MGLYPVQGGHMTLQQTGSLIGKITAGGYTRWLHAQAISLAVLHSKDGGL